MASVQHEHAPLLPSLHDVGDKSAGCFALSGSVRSRITMLLMLCNIVLYVCRVNMSGTPLSPSQRE